jgi:hypothetical protein
MHITLCRLPAKFIQSFSKSLINIVSAVKGVEFVSDRVSYIVLIGRWCNIIVVNVYGPNEEKSDDSKDRFMSN